MNEKDLVGFKRFMADALISYVNGVKPVRYTVCRDAGGFACCVIGAAIVTCDCQGRQDMSELLEKSVGSPRQKIAERYGLDSSDVWDFIDGFDALVDSPEDCPVAWNMGREFSKRLFGE